MGTNNYKKFITNNSKYNRNQSPLLDVNLASSFYFEILEVSTSTNFIGEIHFTDIFTSTQIV